MPDLPPFNITTTAGESDYSKGAAHSINANYRVTEAVNLSYTHTHKLSHSFHPRMHSKGKLQTRVRWMMMSELNHVVTVVI